MKKIATSLLIGLIALHSDFAHTLLCKDRYGNGIKVYTGKHPYMTLLSSPVKHRCTYYGKNLFRCEIANLSIKYLRGKTGYAIEDEKTVYAWIKISNIYYGAKTKAERDKRWRGVLAIAKQYHLTCIPDAFGNASCTTGPIYECKKVK